MNGLRIGIIGVFILLPFLWLASLEVNRIYEPEKERQLVERACQAALRDGITALKTYSKCYYEEERLKQIELAEEECLEIIGRSFAYAIGAKTEAEVKTAQQRLRLIGFVLYDGFIIYDVLKKERLEQPFFQLKMEEQAIYYQKRDLVAESQKGIMDKKWQTQLEQILKPYSGTAKLILPEQSSTLFGKDLAEVGIFLLLSDSTVFSGEEALLKIGKASLSEKKEDRFFH